MPLFSSHTLHPSLNQTMAYYGAGTISLFQARVTPSTLPPLIAVPGAYAHSLVAEVEQALLPLPSPESPSETYLLWLSFQGSREEEHPFQRTSPNLRLWCSCRLQICGLKNLSLIFQGKINGNFIILLIK